jgi:hypothetical protein
MMQRSIRVALAARLFIAAAVLWTGIARAQTAEVRFRAVDVVIDAGEVPLAAYQLELFYDKASSSLVGIEGGEPPYSEAPYYDPKGLTIGRVVIADFSTVSDPPRGRIRVARIHVEERGDPKLHVRLVTVGTIGGRKVWAQIQLVPFGGGENR